MRWLPRPTPARAFVAVSLRDGLTAVRVEPAGSDGGRLRVTLAVHHADARSGARALRAAGALRGAQQLLMLPSALRSFHPLPRPDVPDAELTEAVRWQLAPNLDHAPELALVQALPMPAMSDKPQQQLLAVVAHAPHVKDHLAPLHAAGWAPQIIDIEETAQRNLMLLAEPQAAALACVGFAGHDALITLVADGELCLTRAVSFDAQDLATAGERLALQVQRTLDQFERQTTRHAVRLLLMLPGPMGTGFVGALATQMPLRLQAVLLDTLFDIGSDAAPVQQDPALYAHLLGSVAGRMLALGQDAVDAAAVSAAATDPSAGAVPAAAAPLAEAALQGSGELALQDRK